MKLEIVTPTLEKIENRNGGSFIGILIETQEERIQFFVSDGEPEDNSLRRNFSNCYRIESMLMAAYKAGAKNEPIELIKRNDDEF